MQDLVVGAGKFAHVSPGASLSGGVRVGERHVDTGSSVVQYLIIGDDVLLAVRSVVAGDMPDGVVAFESPARIVRSCG